MTLPHSTFRFIFHFVRKQWIKFALISFSFVIWAASDSLFPYFLKHIVNDLQTYQGQRAGIYTAAGGAIIAILLLWTLAEFFMRIEGILEKNTFPRFRADIREAVFEYATSHSHDYFASQFAGNLAKKLSDLPTSSQTVVEITCFQFICGITGGIIVFSTLWLTNFFFALILFAWLCLHLGITFAFLRRGDKLWENHSESVSTLSGKIIDIFTNMLNVRIFARKKDEARYIQRFQQDEIKKAHKAMKLMNTMRLGLGINGLFLIFAMLFMLLYGWVHHWVSLGDFTQVMMQSFWLLGWLWYITFQLTIFVREKGTIQNALSLIQKSHDIVDKKNAKPIIISKGEIRFESVNFYYHRKLPVFENLNVVIAPGQKTGLVGFSGSGKSTFVNLVLRFYDIQSGKILIDHQNIKEITQDSLHAQIAMIPQDPSLFHRTLMENIRYGRLGASDEEVMEASRKAHCHEFIDKLDEGYNSLVGERGIKLSGGQRQRIAIARAILKNAPILILDEATSSLDSVTEKLIQQSLHDLMKKRTTLVIAHRLSTLADMDKILVFHQGRIIEEGTQSELLKAKGHFAHLWNMQTEGFLPSTVE